MTRGAFDILIVGSGIVGLSAALAMRRSDHELQIAVVDRKSSDEIVNTDQRVFAVAEPSRRMLDVLGVWHKLENDVQLTTSAIVTDTDLQDSIRQPNLTFSSVCPPLAYIVANGNLVRALISSVLDEGIHLLNQLDVSSIDLSATPTRVGFSDDSWISADLVIAADGASSRLRWLAGFEIISTNYDQVAIVTTVCHEKPHNGVTVQHFLPGGPFAIFPLPDGSEERHFSSIVWTESRDQGELLVASDDATFLAELRLRFGKYLGAISVEAARDIFQLKFQLAPRLVKRGFALVGDAAHCIHPILGQGLNIGLTDVAALTEVIVQNRCLGIPIGSVECLIQYERSRRVAAAMSGFIADSLLRFFSIDSRSARFFRHFGVGLIDRMSFLKRRLISLSSHGVSGSLKLFRGQKI